MTYTLVIRLIRIINKVCSFVVVVFVNVDDFCSICSLVARLNWLHEFFGALNDGIKFDIH